VAVLACCVVSANPITSATATATAAAAVATTAATTATVTETAVDDENDGPGRTLVLMMLMVRLVLLVIVLVMVRLVPMMLMVRLVIRLGIVLQRRAGARFRRQTRADQLAPILLMSSAREVSLARASARPRSRFGLKLRFFGTRRFLRRRCLDKLAATLDAALSCVYQCEVFSRPRNLPASAILCPSHHFDFGAFRKLLGLSGLNVFPRFLELDNRLRLRQLLVPFRASTRHGRRDRRQRLFCLSLLGMPALECGKVHLQLKTGVIVCQSHESFGSLCIAHAWNRHLRVQNFVF